MDTPPVSYLRPFLIGVARVAHDDALEEQAQKMAAELSAPDRQELQGLLTERIAKLASV